jgi:hypothetical protein
MVRAISQRWLLNLWKRSLGAAKIPLWQMVESEDLSRIRDSLSFFDVAGAVPHDRYVIRFNGPTIARVYSRTDCRGQSLDQIIPAHHYEFARAPYRQAVASGCPVYTVHDVVDINQRIVHFERLLLPFSSGGETVDRIMASFEFVCADGAFVSDGLLRGQTQRPELKLSATIARHAMA